MATPVNIETLQREIREVQKNNPNLSPDNAFVQWFLQAYLSGDGQVSNIVGGPNDKGVDAILVDHKIRRVFIIQGKYRTAKHPATESRSDVLAFASMVRALTGGGHDLENFLRGADAAIQERAREISSLIRKKHYKLDLYFASTGRISQGLEDEAQRHVESISDQAEFTVFGREKILALLRDYLDGAAPPVPTLDLAIESEERVKGGGVIRRFDPSTGIEAWVFSVLASDVGESYRQAGIRLFSRNVRGFLGSTEINRAMRNTLLREPENFWFFNNGITFVCDAAQMIERRGKQVVRLLNPQIINGQQTTRVLHDHGSRKASVLVRAVAIPRGEDPRGFETLVSSIVVATNWQNKIKQSDLRANDAEQIRIERELRRLGYQYLRKRQTKAEVRRIFGVSGRHQIKKEEIARSVAAAEIDPAAVLLGTEKLFEDKYYRRVFDGRPAKDHLVLVWLNRLVGYTAKGGEWRYTRWLVLNELWERLKPILRREPERSSFLYVSERRSEWVRLRPFDRAVEALVKAVLAFYRANRGKAAAAEDPFAFFKRPDLSERFARFLTSQRGRPFRNGPRRSLKKFIDELAKVRAS